MTIEPKDLSISTVSNGSSWFPRQTGVCITHIPTGLSVTANSERSLHANRDKAFEQLETLLYKAEKPGTKTRTVAEQALECAKRAGLPTGDPQGDANLVGFYNYVIEKFLTETRQWVTNDAMIAASKAPLEAEIQRLTAGWRTAYQAAITNQDRIKELEAEIELLKENHELNRDAHIQQVNDLEQQLATTIRQEPLYFVFDRAPGHQAPRFIEVETEAGESVKIGEWKQSGDGLWRLGPIYKGEQK